MIVNSKQLTAAAATIRMRHKPMLIPAAAVTVSAAQLDTAARILREAEPCIANGDVAERPGFIEKERQDDPKVLVFQMGILPTTEYRISRGGEIQP